MNVIGTHGVALRIHPHQHLHQELLEWSSIDCRNTDWLRPDPRHAGFGVIAHHRGAPPRVFAEGRSRSPQVIFYIIQHHQLLT